MKKILAPTKVATISDEDVLLARSIPGVFAKLIQPSFKFYDHLEPVESILCKTVEKGMVRAIIAQPRRHGKTFFTAEIGAAWYLGNMERLGYSVEIVIATYGQDKSNDTVRSIIQNIKTHAYKKIFPNTVLKSDSIEGPITKLGSKIHSVGVDGPLTGKGADLIIFDDTIKDAMEAQSVTTLKRLRDWYQTVAYTSLYQNGSVIVIGTRWCKDDLQGIIETDSPEEWTVINMPAIIDEGLETERALCPERFTLDRLKIIRSTLSHRWWMTQYQGVPIDAGDDQMGTPKRANYQPKDIFCFIDPAFDGNDKTAFVFGGIDNEKHISILRAESIRKNAIELVPLIAEIGLKLGCRTYIVEKNADKGYTANELRKFNLHVVDHTATKNKVGRILAYVKGNWPNIYCSDRCSSDFIKDVAQWSELSKHDDAIDALAGLIEYLLDGSKKPIAYDASIFNFD
jgi:hypothetical protein